MAEVQCRHFSGYKPCPLNPRCDRATCPSFLSARHSVLIVHLGALGAVLRSTSLLKAVHREFPQARVTWVTQAPAQALLAHLPEIDRVLTLANEDLLQLSALEFDVALVIDKSLTAAGVLSHTEAREVRGFRADSSHGVIVPANPEARELWQIGLSDEKKFYLNKKSEQLLVHEALALGPYNRDPYCVQLTKDEGLEVIRRRGLWSPCGLPVIGINTGCSDMLPAKRMTVEGHRQLIRALRADARLRDLPVVLLGGPEDGERNSAIAAGFPVIESPTGDGLRDGLVSVAACDLVFSGDSLGMHMAIGLGKWVVAWFGPSCAQEIDLYERGEKISARVGCSPCWRRVCDNPVMCYDRVDLTDVTQALAKGRSWLTSSFKPHSPETFFSPSP